MNRINRRSVIVSAAFLLAGAALTAGVWVSRAVGAEDPDTQTLVGKAAPDFSLETLDGKTVKLSEHKGSVVVVDFWATWCPPCRKSLPHIQEMSADKDLVGKGLKVLAVNAQEEKDKAESFVKKNSYSFTVPLDKEGAAMKEYMVRGIPTTVIVGRDGSIKKVFVGFGPDSAKEIDEAVAEALKEDAPKKK